MDQALITPDSSPAISTAYLALQKCMATAGWEINYVDLDLTGDQPRAEIKLERCDGRWIFARVDTLGRASFEVFHRERTLGMSTNTKGRRPLSPQVNDAFMGRHRCLGARHMLRELTSYVVDNATHPIELSDLRKAWAAVMGAPLRLTSTTESMETAAA